VKSRRKTNRRQIFVLTGEEKTTTIFVLLAFVLGLGTAHYRAVHTTPRRQLAIDQTAKSAGLPAEKRAEAKRRKLAK
jgi:hypothetical protein